MSLKKTTRIIVRSLTPNKPYHVQWLLTRKCNYRCRGCNVWQEQDARELSTTQIMRGLDILRELGTIEVTLSGGNPLLRDDIGEIIDYASRFFITTVYDNGSMAVKKIDDLRKADFVAISLDSLDPRKNDYVRGVKGAWHSTMEAVKKLRSEGISVSVSPTISQHNLNEIMDFTNYFLSKNVPIWYCLYSYDTSEQGQLFKIGKKSDEFAITDHKAMVNLCDSLLEMKRKNSNVLMTTQILEVLKSLYSSGKRTWRCRALQSFFVIDHLGRVAGCHVLDPVTTIFDLPKIWNSPKIEALRKTYSQCIQCTYMCYIFYSLHGNVMGNLRIAEDQWRNARLLLKKKDTRQNSAKEPLTLRSPLQGPDQVQCSSP
jgi:MoaA/NifB/PqqE/SkfB family radical SAM enzyme